MRDMRSFREHQGAPLPVEMKCTEIRLFSGCRGRHPLPVEIKRTEIRSFSGDQRSPLRDTIKFIVGAIHESPVFIYDNRSFSGGGTPPLQIWIQCKQLSERPGSRWVSLRLGHVRVLTVPRSVIHSAHAASLPNRSRQPKRGSPSRRSSIRVLEFSL